MKKLEATNSRFDGIKWFLIFTLGILAVVGNLYYAEQSILYRALGLLLIITLMSIIGFQTSKGRKFWVFLKDARMELRKVVWPTRQETMQSSGVVILIVFIVALLMWPLDSILFYFVSKLTH